VAELV